MTTPFKALNPFTPRFIEINYVAPDGGCCALSSSSGSQQSLPDDDPVVESFRYLFQPPDGGEFSWLMWVQDPSNPAQRILIEEFITPGPEIIDITEFFRNSENTSLPGTQRKVFFTLSSPSTSGVFEGALTTLFSEESGTAFSLENWLGVPEHEPLDGWAGVNNVGMVVIESYTTGNATFSTTTPPES